MPKLRVQLPDREQPWDVQLSDAGVTLGKDASRSAVLIPDNRISREHARIYRHEGGFVVEDLGSKNGTLLDGDVLAPREPRPLNPGSVVCLAGICTVTFVDEPAPTTDTVMFSDVPLAEEVVIRQPGELAAASRLVDRSEIATVPPVGLVEEILRLQSQVERQAKRLNLLYQLGQSLSSVFSQDAIFAKAADVLFTVTPADRCCILLKQEGAEKPVTALVRARLETTDATFGDEKSLFISETIVRRAMEEKVSIASFYAQEDEKLKDIASIFSKGIHSVMCAPLLGRSGVLGVIYADRRNPTERFTSDDLELLNAITGETSTAVDNALSYERLSREALARAAYGRFMPRHVVEQILASPQSLHPGGSNQKVTVLFADIRGFTPLAEERSPEQVVCLLNTYFQAMTSIVFSCGGSIDKYIGDGLMALFGAPYSNEEDAANAVKAAITMQQRMPGLCEELKLLNLPKIGIGIGVNTGEVTVGYIGSEQRLDYTAIGDTVNLAARLQDGAAKGQIRISETTRKEVGDRFAVSPLGAIEVKGKKRSVKVFEVKLP